jgi:hypothetical protein
MNATTTYRVTLTDGGTRVVQATDKAEAGELALDMAATAAKAYNVKYGASLVANNVAWGLKDENRTALAVRSIRKAASRG